MKMMELPEGVPSFIWINQNDFSGRKQKKLREEEISICACEKNDECGVGCLNVITSTECTPGYCPCDASCKNQRFQKCEYAKTKLFKTEGRGWGLLADEKIKAGQFIIEYCGEIISSEEATRRSEAYESQGLMDAYIISVTSNTFIDATAKGSLARFINHSCQPNCETRKWNVLGEMRVGIFAKEDIDVGTELAYDYNFEWYGGANVRCLCGALNCCKFLGARSSGFQEHNHVWEEGDARYDVEEIPTYDSAEDEPSSKLLGNGSSSAPESFDSKKIDTAAETVVIGKTKVSEGKDSLHGLPGVFTAKSATTTGARSFNGGRNNQAGSRSAPKRRSAGNQTRKKNNGGKPLDGKRAAELFTSKEAQDEILRLEEIRRQATARLDAVYDEIRPAIEEHERDSQENVDVEVAQKWINPYCSKLKADFALSFGIVKNFMCRPPPQSSCTSVSGEAKHVPVSENKNI